jgi:uncharacterized protein (UPF0333 family)
MAQISRPFQIALLAMVVLAGVWFFALQGHSSSGGSSPTASAPAPAPSSSAAAKNSAGAPTPVYHGAAPGVQGLSRAIANAHKAVATSEQNAKQLASKSAQASNPTPTGGVTASSPAAKTTAPAAPNVTTAPHPAASTPAATKKVAPVKVKSPVTAPNRVPARQALVEQQLKQGAIVAILFWNPKSAVDVVVQQELQVLLAVHHGLRKDAKNPIVSRLVKATGLELTGKIAVNEASAKQVTAFGSITRAVQIYQTPTILILNKKGQTTTLSGLNDAFSIEQAIDEARHQ